MKDMLEALLEALGQPESVSIGGLAPGVTPYIELKYELTEQSRAWLEKALGCTLAATAEAANEKRFTVRVE